MDRKAFFLKGLNSGADKKLEWSNTIFYVVQETEAPKEGETYPYQCWVADKQFWFIDPELGMQPNKVEEFIFGEPLYLFLEEFILNGGDIPNYKGTEPLRTTPGNVYVNHLALCLPFNDTIPFVKGHFNTSKVNSQIEECMIDDPEDWDGVTPPPEGKIYVSQYLQYNDNILSLVAHSRGNVESITEKSLTGHPDRRRLRNELMQQFAGQLSDPAVIAKIGKALEELDREYLKGDPAERYYAANAGKMYGIIRKRLFYMYGGEAPFTDGSTVDFIDRPLDEGTDTTKLAVLANGSRHGSFSRGAQTQLGGAATKDVYRMMGSARISMHDCNTKFAILRDITKLNIKRYIGLSYIENGKSVLITQDNYESLINKQLMIRGPMTCKASDNGDPNEQGKGKSICAVCAGTALAEQPKGLSAACAGLGGRFLTLFLKKMHGSVLKTAKWDYRKHIH